MNGDFSRGKCCAGRYRAGIRQCCRDRWDGKEGGVIWQEKAEKIFLLL